MINDLFDYYTRVIEKTYGDKVTFEGKAKSLLKFGQNEDLGTAGTRATVMTLFGGETEETYVSDNLIDAVVSDDAANTQNIVIEGHTISGSDLTFVVQTATLTGTTPVTLSTPLARATRVYVDDATDLAANSQVYVYQDTATVTGGVPQQGSLIHCSMKAEFNQSTKASTAVSSVDYWLITKGVFAIDRTQSAKADFYIDTRVLGKAFRTLFIVPVNNSGTSSFAYDFNPPLLIPKNSDVRVQAEAGTNNTGVVARFAGYLARTKYA